MGLAGDPQRDWPRGVRGIDVNLFNSLTGAAETLSVITVFVLLALVLAGLVVVVADTSRIHGADAAGRVSAKGSVSHYPLYAHARRWPPRHPASWVAVMCSVVFHRGCQAVTEGYLSSSGARVTWGGQVPLGQPFSVRDPLWAWGTGRSLISSDGSAIPDIVAGRFFDGVALLLLYRDR